MAIRIKRKGKREMTKGKKVKRIRRVIKREKNIRNNNRPTRKKSPQIKLQ